MYPAQLSVHEASVTWWRRAGYNRREVSHTSATTAGRHAKIVDKIAENPALYLEELRGSAGRNAQYQRLPPNY